MLLKYAEDKKDMFVVTARPGAAQEDSWEVDVHIQFKLKLQAASMGLSPLVPTSPPPPQTHTHTSLQTPVDTPWHQPTTRNTHQQDEDETRISSQASKKQCFILFCLC